MFDLYYEANDAEGIVLAQAAYMERMKREHEDRVLAQGTRLGGRGELASSNPVVHSLVTLIMTVLVPY